MKMSEGHGKRISHKRFYAVLILAIALVCLLVNWLIAAASVITAGFTKDMNTLYLREMTNLTQANFKSGLSMRYSGLRAVAESVNDEDMESLEAMERFMTAAEQNNDFEFMAFVDEDGFYYSRDGKRPAASKLSFLAELLDGEDELVSYNETFLDNNMIVLGTQISPIRFEGADIIAIIAGFTADSIGQHLFLRSEDGQTNASIVTGDGGFIVYNTYFPDLPQGSNIISKFREYAEFDEGFSVEQIERDFRDGKAGMVIFKATGVHMCMYYAPIEGTEWYMLMEVPYEVVDEMTEDLSSRLNRNAITMMASLMLLILIIFLIYLMNLRAHSKQLEAARESAEKAQRAAEQASLAKSEFLSRMSHEIRTPMNGIIGMTQIARQNMNDPERVEDCLKKVSLSSKHLMSLINDVLDMSKIESGKIQLKNELFDLRLFLENIENIYGVQAQEKEIDFQILLFGRIDEFVEGDSLRLNQILTNLLSNAFKFTSKGGRVVLAVSELKHEEDTVLLRFSVKDTGIGIKEENLEKIFEAFEQENAEITHKFGGTGLGLSIVRRFSELMGGHVAVHSKYGKGSEFEVDLPFTVTENSHMIDWKADRSPDKRGVESKTYNFGGKHILLAEDNELNREIAVELLGTGTGAAIDEAEDGQRAVALFAESEIGYYDLILMDVQMPHMDGFEATRRIRAMERPDAAVVPIFAMTANAFAEDEEKSRQAGMNAHLSKPLEISAVLAAMDEILNHDVSGIDWRVKFILEYSGVLCYTL